MHDGWDAGQVWVWQEDELGFVGMGEEGQNLVSVGWKWLRDMKGFRSSLGTFGKGHWFGSWESVFLSIYLQLLSWHPHSVVQAMIVLVQLASAQEDIISWGIIFSTVVKVIAHIQLLYCCIRIDFFFHFSVFSLYSFNVFVLNDQ